MQWTEGQEQYSINWIKLNDSHLFIHLHTWEIYEYMSLVIYIYIYDPYFLWRCFVGTILLSITETWFKFRHY